MLVLLAGCGKSPENQQASKNPGSAGGPDGRRVIVAFGDSLTAGYGVEPGNSYPDFLQKQLDAKKMPYRVVNAGVSGETTSDGLARVDSVLAEKPYLVIVEFGGNDGLRGLPVKQSEENLDQIVGRIKQSGIKVLVAGITLPPNYGPDYIPQFNQMFGAVAAKHNAPLIPFLLKGVGGNPDLMQSDGIHPNIEGNRIVADLVFQMLQRVL